MRKFCEDKLIDVIKSVIIEESYKMPKEEGKKSFLHDITDEDRKALVKFARWHNLEHIVYYAMASSEEDEHAFQFYSYAAVTTQQIMAAQHISQALSAKKIPHIFLKGSTIRRIYPEEWMRNSCDVDLLVKNEDLEAAGKIIESLGYTRGGEITHHIAYTNDYIEVELHYLLIEDFLNIKASAILDNVWSCGVRPRDSGNSSYIYELLDEYAYFYQIAHMVRHFNRGGCGIRSVLDIWMLNHRCEFDRVKRDELLTLGGLDLFEKHILALGEYWFADGDGDRLGTVEQWILSGGAFGDHDRIEGVMKSKRRSKIRYLIYVMFPPYNKMCHKYKVLKRHAWLLPVFYIFRYFHLIYLLGINRVINRFKALFKKEKNQSEIDKMLEQLGIIDID